MYPHPDFLGPWQYQPGFLIFARFLASKMGAPCTSAVRCSVLTVRVVGHKERSEQQGDQSPGAVDPGKRARRGVIPPTQWFLVHLARQWWQIRYGVRWVGKGLARFRWVTGSFVNRVLCMLWFMKTSPCCVPRTGYEYVIGTRSFFYFFIFLLCGMYL